MLLLLLRGEYKKIMLNQSNHHVVCTIMCLLDSFSTKKTKKINREKREKSKKKGSEREKKSPKEEGGSVKPIMPNHASTVRNPPVSSEPQSADNRVLPRTAAYTRYRRHNTIIIITNWNKTTFIFTHNNHCKPTHKKNFNPLLDLRNLRNFPTSAYR